MTYDRLVLAYHGTSRDIAERLWQGEPFIPSRNAYDWLGEGIYFWEYGLDRATRWSIERWGKEEAAVVGAYVQLGACYDLLDSRFTDDLRQGAEEFVRAVDAAGDPVPKNRGRDGKARYFDCANLNLRLRNHEDSGVRFQTVRAPFFEGHAIHPESAIHAESHIQLVVRDPTCIVGIFRPWR